MIPVFKPSVGNEELAEVAEALKSGWWGLGPKTAQFEREFAAYVGARHCVGFNSCTGALHLGLLALDVAGAEVVTTSMTFISTNHAILYNQGIPVFADIDADTLNISPQDVARKITPKTKAIVVVHYGGHPCDMGEIGEIASRHGIPVLEDAAHACGARYNDRKIGSISAVTCFSFHAVKNLAMGEGGAITTNDDQVAERLKKLRWMGITKDTWSRDLGERGYSWQYNVEELGYKYHLSDISAAIGLAQLRKLDAANERRRAIAQRYDAGLEALSWLERPVERCGVYSSRHNYVIKTDKRDALADYLKERGVATSVHYIPNHLYDMYAPYRSELPVTESVWKKLLTLPLFPDLTDEQVDSIVDAVAAFGG